MAAAPAAGKHRDGGGGGGGGAEGSGGSGAGGREDDAWGSFDPDTIDDFFDDDDTELTASGDEAGEEEEEEEEESDGPGEGGAGPAVAAAGAAQDGSGSGSKADLPAAAAAAAAAGAAAGSSSSGTRRRDRSGDAPRRPSRARRRGLSAAAPETPVDAAVAATVAAWVKLISLALAALRLLRRAAVTIVAALLRPFAWLVPRAARRQLRQLAARLPRGRPLWAQLAWLWEQPLVRGVRAASAVASWGVRAPAIAALVLTQASVLSSQVGGGVCGERGLGGLRMG